MSYKVLVFEPKLPDKCNNPILWKAQMFPPEEYQSVGVTLLNDNIEVNNRRTCEEWETLLTENGFKYEINYDHEHCKEFIIFDTECVAFSFQIFACDISVADYKVQVASGYILPTLYTLNLQKEGSIFPSALQKRIDEAKTAEQRSIAAIMRMKAMMDFKSKEKIVENIIESVNFINEKVIVFANTEEQAKRLGNYLYTSNAPESEENLEKFNKIGRAHV